MTARDAAVAAFLAAAGCGDAAVAPLAGDASNRRYLRLTRPGGTAVLMDAPPARGEDVRPFLALTEWLRGRGLSAPAPLATDLDAGLLLLEDLGDELFVRHLARRPGSETALYAAAVDLLAGLASVPPPARIGSGPVAMDLLPYDGAVLGREAELFTGWWLPAVAAVSPGMAADYAGLVAEATAPVAGAREVLVLRDYHAENLLWLPGRAGDARVGLLDYQDALAGHAAYDLVSLLEDARRDTGAELRAAMVARYLAARPELDAEAFRAAYAILGAQRNLKIIGIFARLARRDGKPRYLAFIPRVWGHLQRDLAHPSLARLAGWIARHAPAPAPDVLARAGATIPAAAPA
jgi:aminoglycoside/choline kinase family phosphotransferase